MRRTTATTDYLKECMGTALLELMKEKPIEKISIEEMTAKADVGRSTYFRYFKSKDEVLSFKITCLWKRFSDEHGATNFATGSYDGIRLFFEFCLSTRPICDLLYSADRQYVILNFYLQEAASIVANADAKTHYFIQFITYGLFGLMNAWVLPMPPRRCSAARGSTWDVFVKSWRRKARKARWIRFVMRLSA